MYAIMLGVLTFLLTKYILKISVFIPAPLLALGVCRRSRRRRWAGKGLSLVKRQVRRDPHQLLRLHAARRRSTSPAFLGDLAYYVIAIVLVAAIESLLCSRMADRLADNRGLPFNPNKELWGQGMGADHRSADERISAHRRTGAHRHQHQARRRFAAGGHLQVRFSNCCWRCSWRSSWRWSRWPASAAFCCTSRQPW